MRHWYVLLMAATLVHGALGCTETESEGNGPEAEGDSNSDSDTDSDSDSDTDSDTDSDSDSDTDSDSDSDPDGGPDGGEDTGEDIDTGTDCASAGGECENQAWCYGPEIEAFTEDCETAWNEICCGPTDCPWECASFCGYYETEHEEYDCGSWVCCEPT
jgi:hypothetical protein